MPNPPTPIEQRRKLGNPSGRKLPDPVASQPALKAVPDRTPDAVLDDVLAHASVWLGSTDALAVALLRSLLDERAEVAAALAAGDDLYTRHDLRKIDADVIKLLGELGLTPTARARLGLSEVKAASALDEMRRRSA